MSGRGGRATSGPWSRLKPVTLDPLESYGLPSKGDNRLLDFKTQERYYTKIVDRYMSFCSQAGRSDELLRRFSSLHLDQSAPTSTSTSTPATATAAVAAPAPAPASGAPQSTTTLPDPDAAPAPTAADPQASQDLSSLVLALRKLREALVATGRADAFATQCYLFAIRLAILLRDADAYHPALLYLLRALHPRLPLPAAELREVAAYRVLDLACRQRDLAAAYAERARYRLRDAKVAAVLAALVHDDYWAFWRARRAVDGYRARLLDWADDAVRLHALKCLGRSYLTLDVEFVERAAGGRTWEELVTLDRVGWELKGGKVVLRKAKGS